MMDHPQLLLLLLFHFSIFTPISGICTFPTQKMQQINQSSKAIAIRPHPRISKGEEAAIENFFIQFLGFLFFFSWPFGPGLDRQKEIKVPREGGGADPPPPPTFVCSFPL